MNSHPLLPLLIAVLPCSVFAADWVAMDQNPAQIEVAGMHTTPLVESKEPTGWAKVPRVFETYHAVSYTPADKYDGEAIITVTGDGYLLLACNFDYQGNKHGAWVAEAWDEQKFKSKGWHLLSKHELVGDLVKGNDRAQVVFAKEVHKGETLHLRCNKYDPPFPIVLGAKITAAR